MSLQPVSMSMSNLNLDSAAKISPNALTAAQDTGQSQEIIQESIRSVQTVQASDAASRAQRVHRKDTGDDDREKRRQGGHSGQDSFTRTEGRPSDKSMMSENAPIIRETVKIRKGGIEFLA